MSRRREIVRRATELFERQGVSRTSIEDIARAVGIKREGVYYYFKSRADILLQVVLPQSNTLLLNLKSVAGSNTGSAEKLHGAIRNHLDSFNPNYLEMTVALREDHFFQDEAKLRELRRVWTEYSEIWTDLVREGQRDGTFRRDLNPKMAAYGILGMCNWVSRWFDPAKEISISELIDTFFSLAAHGIMAPEPDSAVEFPFIAGPSAGDGEYGHDRSRETSENV